MTGFLLSKNIDYRDLFWGCLCRSCVQLYTSTFLCGVDERLQLHRPANGLNQLKH